MVGRASRCAPSIAVPSLEPADVATDFRGDFAADFATDVARILKKPLKPRHPKESVGVCCMESVGVGQRGAQRGGLEITYFSILLQFSCCILED